MDVQILLNLSHHHYCRGYRGLRHLHGNEVGTEQVVINATVTYGTLRTKAFPDVGHL